MNRGARPLARSNPRLLTRPRGVSSCQRPATRPAACPARTCMRSSRSHSVKGVRASSLASLTGADRSSTRCRARGARTHVETRRATTKRQLDAHRSAGMLPIHPMDLPARMTSLYTFACVYLARVCSYGTLRTLCQGLSTLIPIDETFLFLAHRHSDPNLPHPNITISRRNLIGLTSDSLLHDSTRPLRACGRKNAIFIF